MVEKVALLVRKYKETKEDHYFTELLKEMYPLINRYARNLYYLEYEDSVQELELAMFEAIIKMKNTDNDYACLSYIHTTVKHKFCKLYALSCCKCREYKQQYEISNEVDEDTSSQTATKDIDFLLDLQKELSLKPKKQRVIIQLLMEGYHDSEISRYLGVTRQYVNRIKKNIINFTLLQ